MAVAVVTQFRVTPGRHGEFIKESAVVKPLLERHGARARMFTATLAGPNTGLITGLMEFDDLAAYAAFAQKAQADQELQAGIARLVGGANPASTMIASSILVEIPL